MSNQLQGGAQDVVFCGFLVDNWLLVLSYQQRHHGGKFGVPTSGGMSVSNAGLVNADMLFGFNYRANAQLHKISFHAVRETRRTGSP